MRRGICRPLVVLLLAGSLSLAAAGPLQEADTAYANGDYTTALRLWRELAEQGDAIAQSNLGRMYRDGRGVAADQAEAVKWLRMAAEQGHAGAQSNLEQGDTTAQNSLARMYEQGRGGLPKDDRQAAEWRSKAARQIESKAEPKGEPAPVSTEDRVPATTDLSRRITELVKTNEATQDVGPIADSEGARLVREVLQAYGQGGRRASADEMNEKFAALKKPANISQQLWDAIGITLVASFRPDRIDASMEHRLGQGLDVATLEFGLTWERTDLARRMHQLDRQASSPEQRTALNEFVRDLLSKGGRTSDPRARACAQADTLADRTDTVAPLMEAMTAGVMIASSQQAPAMDRETIGRAVLGARPLMHEAARESVLAQCLFAYKTLSDAEIEEWLQFLRSDAGGRYARGVNDATRDALLDVTEVFTRTLLEVTRQIKAQAVS